MYILTKLLYIFLLLAYHSKGGPLTVTEGSHPELTSIMQKGAAQLGYKNTDCNAKEPIGINIS